MTWERSNLTHKVGQYRLNIRLHPKSLVTQEKKSYFPQISLLLDPPDPPLGGGSNFKNPWNDLGEVQSNAPSRSIAFKHPFTSKIFGYTAEKVIFSSNQPPIRPPWPPAEEGQISKIDEMTWERSNLSHQVGQWRLNIRLHPRSLVTQEKKSYFSQISLLLDPLTPRWGGSNFKNRWNDLGEVQSIAPSRSIAFKHPFTSKIFGYTGEKVIFSSNQPPIRPPWPPAEGGQISKIDEMTWERSNLTHKVGQ